MGEKTNMNGCGSPHDAVCVHTSKVTDSCRSKECISDLRVYLTRQSQELLDRSSSVKPRSAELLWVSLDVSPVDFNRGFFSVDARFFYRVSAEVCAGVGRMTSICGLAVYDKRAILFGCEGSTRTFTSDISGLNRRTIERSNMPRAVVETIDPLLLSAKIVERHHHCPCCCCCDDEIPEPLGCIFDDDLILDDDVKKLVVSLGQFSVIRLERDVQLLMPAYDYCMPNKECMENGGGTAADPCEMFSRIEFPVNDFIPQCNVPRTPCTNDGGCKKCGQKQ